MEGRHGDGSPKAGGPGLAPGLAKIAGEAFEVPVLGGAGDEPEFFVFEFGNGGFDHAVVPAGAEMGAARLVGWRLDFIGSFPGQALVVGIPRPATPAMTGDDDTFVVVDPKRTAKDSAGLDSVPVGGDDELPLSVYSTFCSIDSVHWIFPAIQGFEADEFAGDGVLRDRGRFLGEAGCVWIRRRKINELPGFAIVERLQELLPVFPGVVADFFSTHPNETASGIGGRGGDDAGRRDFAGQCFDRVGALPADGLRLHFAVSIDKLSFEFCEASGFFLGEVGLLEGIGEDVEELESNELAILNEVKVGFFPA